jgi:hypothetical protein
MKQVTIYVEEKLSHKVTIELDNDAAKSLIEELKGGHANDIAGDMTRGRMTAFDGEFELSEYEVKDV